MVSSNTKILLPNNKEVLITEVQDDTIISSEYIPNAVNSNVSHDRIQVETEILGLLSSSLDNHRENCLSVGYESTGIFSIDINIPIERDSDGNLIKGELFEDALQFTENQAFLTKRGWCSILPDSNVQPFIIFEEKKLVEGDEVYLINDWAEIKKIKFRYQEPSTPVYGIDVEKTGTYYANRILVHE